MSIPEPPLGFKNHCSAVFDNTLYVYSPAGFQSLPLTKGAKWQTLAPGVSVTGAVCAPATANGNSILYVVGGAANTTSSSYSGLQRYSVSDKSWETVVPIVPVTQNRQNHGASYINSLASILVYAGSQVNGDTGPSSQTFLISTAPPYGVLSFSAQAAPPLFAPFIMQWDDQHALMIGGSAANTQVFTFGQPEGWVNLGTALTAPIANPSTTQCSIVTGDDGSKVLETYDLGVTPNQVSRVALWADGKPAPVGQTVGGPSSKKRKRELTVDNWPAYNSSLAPTTKRADYSIAESSDGLVVMTGGDSSDPLAIFNQRENTWVNATSLLVAKNQVPLTTPTSSSLPSVSVVTPTAVASTSSTSTSSSEGSPGQPRSRVLHVLGGALGAIFAAAAILIIILLLLRRNRQKKKKSATVDEKDGRLSFADQGAEFMHEAGGSRGRAYSASLNESIAALPVFNKNKSSPLNPKTKSSHRRGMPSDSSQLGLVKAKSPLGVNEPLEMSQMSEKSSPTYATSNGLAPNAGSSPPEYRAAPMAAGVALGAAVGGAAVAGAVPDDNSERSRSNGWSRYFANNEVTNLASMQPNRSTFGTEADTYRSSDVSRSDYDDRNMSNSSVPRPLELNLGPKFDGQRLSRVATGSPTMGRSAEELHRNKSQHAQISRTGSSSSGGSDHYGYESSTRDNDTRDGASTTYTPMSAATLGDDRRKNGPDTKSIGSVYSDNGNPFYSTSQNPYQSATATSNFYGTGAKTNLAPTIPDFGLGRHQFGEQNRDSHASEASAITVFPSGIAQSPKLAAMPRSKAAPTTAADSSFDFPMPKAYFSNTQQRDSSASNVTVFPRGVPSPITSSFPKPKLVDARSPQVPPVPPVPDSPSLRRGPVIRKTTGDEDMSWLNINAGRAI